ncbi:MAG: hypothetical protein GY882_01720 [Actinomycetia bacterium]|nr:hypothetical protein [Actinomycetes bacterium]MCP4844889.1 hypothetical protein [Actinomycetes bacterium]
MQRNRIPFEALELGDIVAIPGGRLLMARSKVTLPAAAGTMGGFILCGEFEALLSIPATPGDRVALYAPVAELPVGADEVTIHSEGAANYWSPHLPSVQGAMGEVLWRVLTVRGSIDPVVVVWRGPEVVVFVRTDSFDQCELDVLWAHRTVDNQFDVEREAGFVEAPVAMPHAIPAPQRERVGEPVRVPQRAA